MNPAQLQPLIGIDLETGGLYPGWNPILSISIATSGFAGPPLSRTWYIDLTGRDEKAVEAKAREVNGYNYDTWKERGAVPLPLALIEVRRELTALLQERPNALFVAHSAGFDRAFLDYAFLKWGEGPLDRYQWRCSQQLLAQLMDQGLIPQGSLGLDRLGELSGQWPVSGRPAVHEAHEDALACLIGYQWLLSIQARPMELLRRFWNLSSVGGGLTADWLQVNGEADALLSPLPPTNPPVL
jgi:hypothetical protein